MGSKNGQKILTSFMDGPMGGTAAAVESACGQFGILIRYKNRPNLQTHTHNIHWVSSSI